MSDDPQPPGHPRILVGIPVYNCESQIPRVLDQFDPSVLKFITEIIVVDNRSKDKTRDAAAKKIAGLDGINASVLMNTENRGYGGTLKVIFNYAFKNKYDYLIILHGDDQADIREFVPYLRSKEYQSFDCFLGARFMRSSHLKGYSAFRTFGNKVFNWLYSLVLARRIHDLGSGLNLYRVSLFADQYYKKLPEDLTFDYCNLIVHSHLRRRIKFFPISWREEDQISNVRIVRQALKSMMLIMSYFLMRGHFLQRDWRTQAQKLDDYEIVARRVA